MIKDDFNYYTVNQDEIVKSHLGEYVVIMNSEIKGYFREESQAFDYMKGNELGTFMVKRCQEPGTDIINYFNNNVAFA